MIKYISNSCVIAAIMKFNIKYFKEIYVTEKQLSVITWYIQKKLKESNSNIVLVNYVDNFYFEDMGNKIMLNDEYLTNFYKVENNYKKKLPIELTSIIWNDDFMKNIVIDNFYEIVKDSVKTLIKK